MPSKVRATLTGVTVSCGVISFAVDLVPATKAKADKRAANAVALTRICPTCADPTTIEQLLFCTDAAHHGPFTTPQLGFAAKVDGELERVVETKVVEAKTPEVNAKTVAFSVFPAGQVEAATLPSGNVYRMRLPAKAGAATTSAYALMLALAADVDLAFLAELVVKGVSKLYRGVVRDGLLTLTELYRPSLFHEPESIEVACDNATVRAGKAVVAELLTDFDPAGWESAAETRLLALQEAAKAGTEATEATEIEPATAAAEDLLSLLRQTAA